MKFNLISLAYVWYKNNIFSKKKRHINALGTSNNRKPISIKHEKNNSPKQDETLRRKIRG